MSRRLAAIIAVTIIAGLLAGSSALHREIMAGIATAEPLIARHPFMGAGLFLGLAALSAIVVFFSGLLLVPIGVQVWGEIGCGLLLWAGWSFGGLLTYAVGRHLGRPMVKRLLPDGAMAHYENRIPRRGSFLTALLVQLALPSDVSGYFFGLLRYPAHAYFGGLVMAELPYALGTVFLGAAFMQGRSGLLLSLAAIALALLGLRWLRHRHS